MHMVILIIWISYYIKMVNNSNAVNIYQNTNSKIMADGDGGQHGDMVV